MNEIFDRGEVKGYWVEHNGIDYAVTEWACHHTGEFDGYMLWWVQHGQSFRVSVPACFTLDEALAFAYAVPVTTWQLDGDAVSISIQGMADVTIQDANGNEIIAMDDMLFDTNMEKIGYRWLIDEAAQRYQYVLQYGTYTFLAANVISSPGLLINHFESGEIISSVDYTEKLAMSSFDEFSVVVTPDPGGSDLIASWH